jgi:hypothetical protein
MSRILCFLIASTVAAHTLRGHKQLAITSEYAPRTLRGQIGESTTNDPVHTLVALAAATVAAAFNLAFFMKQKPSKGERRGPFAFLIASAPQMSLDGDNVHDQLLSLEYNFGVSDIYFGCDWKYSEASRDQSGDIWRAVYRGMIIKSILVLAQMLPEHGVIYVLCIQGGPVSQWEAAQMQDIINSAKLDLATKHRCFNRIELIKDLPGVLEVAEFVVNRQTTST